MTVWRAAYSTPVKLPNDSVIPQDKIRRYLLLPQLEDDKSKFLALARYTLANWERLEKDLQAAIQLNEAYEVGSNSYGAVYELKAKWTGPNGKQISVLTIWIRLNTPGKTNFVTLYPNKEEKK